MAWLDNLQPCSYGGVQFHARVISGTQGRRIVTHRRLNAAPLSEDIGASTRSYVIQGYFVQNRTNQDPYNDYLRLRNLVMAGGVRPFNHPHFGFIAHAEAASIVEQTRNRSGGFISFTMTIDANRKTGFQHPQPRVQTELKNASDELGVSAIRLFTPETIANFDPITPVDIAGSASVFKKFQPPNSPIEEDGLRGIIGKFTDRVKRARGALLGPAAAALQSLDDAVSGPLDAYNSAVNLSRDVQIVIDGFSGINRLSSPMEIVEFFQRNPLQQVLGSTIYHTRVEENNTAFNNLVGLSSLRSIGRALSDTPIRDSFPSRDEALALSNRVQGAIRTQQHILQTGDAENASQSLKSYTAAIVAYQDEFLPQLSRLRTVENQNRSAFYAANRYLNDVNQVSRLVNENNALHPSKLPERIDLRVS